MLNCFFFSLIVYTIFKLSIVNFRDYFDSFVFNLIVAPKINYVFSNSLKQFFPNRNLYLDTKVYQTLEFNFTSDFFCYYILKELLRQNNSFKRVVKKFVNKIEHDTSIAGYKIMLYGRFNKREKATHYWLQNGNCSISNISSPITYSSAVLRSVYGLCGIKVWIQKKPYNVFKLYSFLDKQSFRYLKAEATHLKMLDLRAADRKSSILKRKPNFFLKGTIFSTHFLQYRLAFNMQKLFFCDLFCSFFVKRRFFFNLFFKLHSFLKLSTIFLKYSFISYNLRQPLFLYYNRFLKNTIVSDLLNKRFNFFFFCSKICLNITNL